MMMRKAELHCKKQNFSFSKARRRGRNWCDRRQSWATALWPSQTATTYPAWCEHIATNEVGLHSSWRGAYTR